MVCLIESERLRLRPHTMRDVPFMLELNSDPLVVRYTGDVAFASESEAEEVVRALKKQFAEKTLGRLVAIARGLNQPIGWCGFKWHEDEAGVDLGFRFLRAEWGKGYATEAGCAALRWLTANTGISKVIANAFLRILARCEFSRSSALSASVDLEMGNSLGSTHSCTRPLSIVLE